MYDFEAPLLFLSSEIRSYNFMDEMHIGSSCFSPAAFASPLLCAEDQEVRPGDQALLPSKLMKNIDFRVCRLSSVCFY